MHENDKGEDYNIKEDQKEKEHKDEDKDIHEKGHPRKTKKIKWIIAIIIIILAGILLAGFFAYLASLNRMDLNTSALQDNNSIGNASNAANLQHLVSGKTIMILGASGNIISLKNTGNETIQTDELTVIDERSFVTCNWTAEEADPGETFNCIMLEGCRTGKIKVYAPGNSEVAIC